MKINIIANHLRSQNNEPLTVEMLEAELKETVSLRPKTWAATKAKIAHITSLQAAIARKKITPPVS